MGVIKNPQITFYLVKDNIVLEVGILIDIVAVIKDLLEQKNNYHEESFETDFGTLTLLSRNIKIQWIQKTQRTKTSHPDGEHN